MYPVDLLIFDLDGTLIDSKVDIAYSVNLTFRDLGLKEKRPEEIYSYIGEGVKKLIKASLGEEKEALFDEAIKIFKGYYLAHLLDTTSIYHGVDKVLYHFKDKDKAITTNKPIEYTVKIVDGLGLRQHFKVILAGNNGIRLKPEADMLIKVISDLNVQKEKAVMIGDGVNDILAARAAGIISCAIGSGLGDKDALLSLNPDYFCERIEDIKGLFF